MTYIIHVKWGGLHGDIALQRTTGELLYVLKGPASRYSWKFAVLDAKGEEAFHIRNSGFFGTAYRIQRAGHSVGQAGSNWCWSRGRIELTERPAVHCKYGWGIRQTLAFMDGPKNVASITILGGIGARAALLIDDAVFDEPRFLIGCALVFRDWTSRG